MSNITSEVIKYSYGNMVWKCIETKLLSQLRDFVLFYLLLFFPFLSVFNQLFLLLQTFM